MLIESKSARPNCGKGGTKSIVCKQYDLMDVSNRYIEDPLIKSDSS